MFITSWQLRTQIFIQKRNESLYLPCRI